MLTQRRGDRPGYSETFPFRLEMTPGERSLAYFDAGPPATEDGPPILFCHGLGGNFTHWEHVVGPLSRHHRVFGLDLPGCGDSYKVPRGGPRYTARLYADAMVRLCDHLQIERAVFAGHSLGGMIVTEAALTHPSRVESLVLVDGAGFRRYSAALRFAARVLLRPEWVGPAMERLALTLLNNVFHTRNANVLRFIGQADGRPAHPTIDEFAEMSCSLAPDLVGKHFLDEVERIVQPTLVIWGDRDKLLPYADVKRWIGRLPNARLVTVRECGHMPIIEHPHVVIDAIREFLAVSEIHTARRRSGAM